MREACDRLTGEFKKALKVYLLDVTERSDPPLRDALTGAEVFPANRRAFGWLVQKAIPAAHDKQPVSWLRLAYDVEGPGVPGPDQIRKTVGVLATRIGLPLKQP